LIPVRTEIRKRGPYPIPEPVLNIKVKYSHGKLFQLHSKVRIRSSPSRKPDPEPEMEIIQSNNKIALEITV
jgi:hypothetical protein